VSKPFVFRLHRIQLAMDVLSLKKLPVLKRIATTLALFAAVLLTDIQWSAMQSVTWVKMVSEGDRAAGLVERIIQTISASTPCDHCVALENERTSEEEKNLNLLTKFQVLAPIGSDSLRFSHPGAPLFLIEDSNLTPAKVTPEGIDHPPRA